MRVKTSIENGSHYFERLWPQLGEILGTHYYTAVEGNTDPFCLALDQYCMLDYWLWDLESRVIGLSLRCQPGPNYRSYTIRIPSEVIKLREIYLGNRVGAQYLCQAYFSTDGDLVEAGLIKTSTLFKIIASKPDWIYQRMSNCNASGNNRFWVIEWEKITDHFIWSNHA